MKSYRVQMRYEGKHYDGIIKADNDVLALQQFEKKLTNGEIKAQDEPLYTKKFVCNILLSVLHFQFHSCQ